MTIVEIVKQGLHYARTCKSLWLFGFFVGLASGGSSSSGGGGGTGGVSVGSGGFSSGLSLREIAAIVGAPFGLSVAAVALIVVAIILLAAALVVMRYVSEGALIEGVVRARQGGRLTMGEGFRAGWAHWGVLVRIALLYFAATVGSLVLFVAPCVLAFLAFGPIGGVALGIPGLVIGVPWLVTLYLVQAFASRIAVLENRRAIDAIGKARLFLHGRLTHSLKLIVATFIGSLGIGLLAIVVMVPVALLLVALVPVLQVLPAIALAGLVLAPIIYVLSAILGTFRSSIWTIGYVTQVGA